MFRKKSYFMVSLPGRQDIKYQRLEMVQRGKLKKEKESLVFATQEQALKTNSVAYSIEKTSEVLLCCRFKEKIESVTLFCSKSIPKTTWQAEKESTLASLEKLPCNKKLYLHSKRKMIWDFPVEIDTNFEFRSLIF